jgi:oligosaccharide repeat unit polymerase
MRGQIKSVFSISKFAIRGPLIVCLSLVLFSLPFLAEGLDHRVVTSMSIIAATGVLFHLSANAQKNWLRIDTVFIVGFIVVNFQWPIMASVFGLVPKYGFQSASLYRSGNYAISIATAALISWMIGYSFKPNPLSKPLLDSVQRPLILAAAFAGSIAAFSYFAGAAFFSRNIYTTVNRDLYLTVGGIGGYLFVIVEILALITLSVILYNRMILPSIISNKKFLSSSLTLALSVLIITYCLVFLVGGERGQIVTIVLGAGLAIAARVRPVRHWEFSLLALLGFLVFSALGILRTGQGFASIGLMGEFGLWGVSSNLAQSIVTLTQAVIIVDGRPGFFFGQLWISQILGLIPFLQSLFLSVTGLTIFDISSAMLITKHTFGNSQTSGLGTSFVADIYLNFGVPGVVVLSGVFGAVSARMTNWLHGDNGFMQYFTAVSFASLILYVARSSILYQAKPIIWGLLIIVVLVGIRRFR